MIQKRTKFPEKPVQLSFRLLHHERALVTRKAAMANMTVTEYCRTSLGLPSGLEYVETEDSPLPDKMIQLPGSNGRSFRCSCGCNVFKEYAPLKYRCNSCNAMYTGEKS